MLALIALLVYEQVYIKVYGILLPLVIIALIRAISIRIIGMAHIITL